MILVGEVMGTLNLVQYIKRRYKNIESREVIICSNNKINLKNINREVYRESKMIQKAGVIIAAMKEEAENISINISFEYSNNKLRQNSTF